VKSGDINNKIEIRLITGLRKGNKMSDDEKALVREYLETKNLDILSDIINHPWAYSVSLLQWAIDLYSEEKIQ
jgi:hypothetical protein